VPRRRDCADLLLALILLAFQVVRTITVALEDLPELIKEYIRERREDREIEEISEEIERLRGFAETQGENLLRIERGSWEQQARICELEEQIVEFEVKIDYYEEYKLQAEAQLDERWEYICELEGERDTYRDHYIQNIPLEDFIPYRPSSPFEEYYKSTHPPYQPSSPRYDPIHL
jgi:hypothetical protein